MAGAAGEAAPALIRAAVLFEFAEGRLLVDMGQEWGKPISLRCTPGRNIALSEDPLKDPGSIPD